MIGNEGIFSRRSCEGGNPSRDILTKILMVVTCLALAACGSRTELTPPPGKSLPPKPIAADTTPTAEELMEPSTQSRPGRSDELLKQSERRKPDEFDLPPN